MPGSLVHTSTNCHVSKSFHIVESWHITLCRLVGRYQCFKEVVAGVFRKRYIKKVGEKHILHDIGCKKPLRAWDREKVESISERTDIQARKVQLHLNECISCAADWAVLVTNTDVPPYPLIQNPRFTSAWKIIGKLRKSTFHNFQNACQARTDHNMVKSTRLNLSSTLFIFRCPRTHAFPQNLPPFCFQHSRCSH
jgi:hypothetical protein